MAKRGRPKGSKNKPKRGRPKGSKNKPKPGPRIWRSPVEGAAPLLCPHCRKPFQQGISFADLAPGVSEHSILHPIPEYYKGRTNPAVLSHYLSRTLFYLLGIPVGAIRKAFLREVGERVAEVHPNYTRSALRACIEADLTQVGPYLEIPMVYQERVRRTLETLDILQTIADLRNRGNRNAGDQEAKADGLSDSARMEADAEVREDATGSGEGNVQQAGEEVAPEEVIESEEEIVAEDAAPAPEMSSVIEA